MPRYCLELISPYTSSALYYILASESQIHHWARRNLVKKRFLNDYSILPLQFDLIFIFHMFSPTKQKPKSKEKGKKKKLNIAYTHHLNQIASDQVTLLQAIKLELRLK